MQEWDSGENGSDGWEASGMGMDTKGKCPWILKECDDRTQRGINIYETVKTHAAIYDMGHSTYLEKGIIGEGAERGGPQATKHAKSRALDTLWYMRQENNLEENEGCA